MMVYEILPPFLAAFVISQSAQWTTDLTQGRVQLFLSAPYSWSGLILRRITATFIGAELLIISSIATTIVGSKVQEVDINSAGIS